MTRYVANSILFYYRAAIRKVLRSTRHQQVSQRISTAVQTTASCRACWAARACVAFCALEPWVLQPPTDQQMPLKLQLMLTIWKTPRTRRPRVALERTFDPVAVKVPCTLPPQLPRQLRILTPPLDQWGVGHLCILTTM